MPQIDVVISKIGQSKFISNLDLTKAFWQIPLTERSINYTTFVTPDGQYNFTVLAFDINVAPAICNRLMTFILKI